VTDIKKILFFFSLLCILSPGFYAQDSLTRLHTARQLKSLGNSGMMLGDYGAASVYFEGYMKLRQKDYKIAFKLAESYRMNRDYAPALTWYEKSYTLSDKTYALPLFYYALMLKMNGNCEKAKENFLLFKKIAQSDDLSQKLKKQLKTEIAGCDSIQSKPSKTKIAITHLDTSINKIHVEASPIFLNDSNIVYAALRSNKKEYIIANDSLSTPLRKLYTAKKLNGKWTYGGEYAGPPAKQGMNVGGGSFSPDGTHFYFTQCHPNWKNKMICSLYASDYNEGGWTEPVLLNKTINLPDFTSSQPTVSANAKGIETIYFVSDRPGGKGGMDIWYFTYNVKTKKYGTPRNAGGKINTANEEMTPYYDQETGSLYFSSDGWPGMGGMDIFKAIGESKAFSLPENLGSAINTTYDDLNFTISKDRESGMLVSNRKGGVASKNPTCCDDLYEYKRMEFIHLRIAGNLQDEGKDSLNKKPMTDATVSLFTSDPLNPENSVFIKKVKANADGHFEFSVEPGNVYKVVAEKENYLNEVSTLSTMNITSSQNLTANFRLKEIAKEGFQLKNIYYATDKFDLSPAAKAGLDTTLFVLLKQNPELKIEIGSHTDDVGSDKYNNTLSQKRADGVVKYMISKGINPERLTGHGYGKTMPKVPNNNPDGSANPVNQEKNRRTEFKVIGKVDNLDIRNED
jgi:OOP family OmpA-OmpF porin